MKKYCVCGKSNYKERQYGRQTTSAQNPFYGICKQLQLHVAQLTFSLFPSFIFLCLILFPLCFSSSLPSLVLPLCTTDKASCRLQSTGKVSNCNSFSGPFRLILTFVLLYFEAFLSTRQQKVAILCLLWLQLYWITLHHCFPFLKQVHI